VRIKIVERWVNNRPLKCDACLELERLLRIVLDELGLVNVDIQRCASEEEYNSYGVIATPVLIINDKIKMSGKVPPKEMLKEFLKFELEKEKK